MFDFIFILALPSILVSDMKFYSFLIIYEIRAIQINCPPARTRPEITRSNGFGGRTRVSTPKTWRRRVGCRISSSKTRETQPVRRPLKSGHFFPDFNHFFQISTFFSRFQPFFPISAIFFQILATFSLKSVDFWHNKHRIWPNQWFLITIW